MRPCVPRPRGSHGDEDRPPLPAEAEGSKDLLAATDPSRLHDHEQATTTTEPIEEVCVLEKGQTPKVFKTSNMLNI